jgi:diguanylate cyclase (GGDEF)-like protein
MASTSGDRSFSEERHICCSMTSVLLRTVRSQRGTGGVRELLARAGTHHDPLFLEDTDNWVSLEEAMALLEAGIAVTGDPDLPQRVGADTIRQHAGTQVSTLLRSLGSPEAVLAVVTNTSAKLSAVSDLATLETQPGFAVVRAVAREGFRRYPVHCAWTRGLLTGPCTMFGLTSTVEEVECQARGGHECRYEIRWDAEEAAAVREPEQQVLALEAQVVALTQRLENAYATASDLISPDDLDTVLIRIISRAAGAVRAPGYVLVVTPEPGGRRRLFSDGVPVADAERLALASDAEAAALGSALLSVEVASGRRQYGRLVAVQPSGMPFFPQERQLLALYAKHAAAVLDTAVALDEARRRQDHLAGLLSLASTLARAGGTEDVARRLLESVRGVVDCDTTGVWVWDARQGRLRRAAAARPGPLPDRERILLEETPYLAQMLQNPRPMFFDQTVTDPFLRSTMNESGQVALVVVPVIAREGFVGLLAVGVLQNPERLASSSSLLEKLEGVAALAAPALQNGLLIDELDRQVVHDELTGILNRTGFVRSIEGVLERLGGDHQRAGLLFVDLDGFKALNDRHGHHFGDQLLSAVAGRLRARFREHDAVARVGGDEFAVVLPNVTSEADLDVAARRAQEAFADPFRVDEHEVHVGASIGQALAPEDGGTVDALVRRADLSMYRQKERSHARRALAL